MIKTSELNVTTLFSSGAMSSIGLRPVPSKLPCPFHNINFSTIVQAAKLFLTQLYYTSLSHKDGFYIQSTTPSHIKIGSMYKIHR